ncbi:MAG: biotin--[acetyl-CoA-carboxylase] ligase [Amoebophilaceae bacterium]|nr:biotin--[acetyl-CoA-carboxylase] ligase [Amoebophilaceae bacterium]
MEIKKAAFIVKRWEHDTIDSTHTWAKSYIREMVSPTIRPHHWHLVTAEAQTKGVGQYSNQWTSPYGYNIYATWIIPWPKLEKDKLWNITQVATIAVAETMEGYGFTPQIKWINDLLLDGKKCGGILCEHRIGSSNGAYDWLLMSVGVNVNMTQADGSFIDQPFTSLYMESGQRWDREMVLMALQARIFYHLKKYIAHGFGFFYEALNKRLIFMNETIGVESKNTLYKGVFKGITEKGAMILQIQPGLEEKILFSGRIVKGV